MEIGFACEKNQSWLNKLWETVIVKTHTYYFRFLSPICLIVVAKFQSYLLSYCFGCEIQTEETRLGMCWDTNCRTVQICGGDTAACAAEIQWMICRQLVSCRHCSWRLLTGDNNGNNNMDWDRLWGAIVPWTGPHWVYGVNMGVVGGCWSCPGWVLGVVCPMPGRRNLSSVHIYTPWLPFNRIPTCSLGFSRSGEAPITFLAKINRNEDWTILNYLYIMGSMSSTQLKMWYVLLNGS